MIIGVEEEVFKDCTLLSDLSEKVVEVSVATTNNSY